MNKPFWYKTPNSLSWDGWTQWCIDTRQQYPIQYFFREDIRMYFNIRWRRIRDFKYKVKCLLFPYHQELHKAIPKTWADISSLVIDLNFAMILSFKKEADASCVDWDGTENHRKFKNWLDSAANWIQEGRPALEKLRDNAYPPYPLPDRMKDWNYEQLYSEVNRIEKLINDTDTNIIKQMIDYREYMWT